MTKKICALLLTMVLVVSSIMTSFAQESIELEGSSALLMETKYNQIIYQKDYEKRRLPASVTKIMTVAVAFDIIEEKEIPLEKITKISKHAANIRGARIDLKAGDLVSVEALLNAIILNSANNATVALAEFFSGSEAEYVKLMNQKAQQMGLKNTHFISVNGFTLSDDHYSTAYDIAQIAKELIEEGDILRYSPQKTKTINIYKDNPVELLRTIDLESTNKLLGEYEGIDGMKTGWMGAESGFCFVGTAKRGDTRLLSVTLGAQQENGNFRDTSKLLDYGFNNFRYIPLLEKDETISKTKVKGALKSLKGNLEEDLIIFGKYSQEAYKTEVVLDELVLPITKGDRIGVVDVYEKDRLVMQRELVAKNNVKKSMIISMLEKLKNLF